MKRIPSASFVHSAVKDFFTRRRGGQEAWKIERQAFGYAADFLRGECLRRARGRREVMAIVSWTGI
jgi:hypothetical protein